MARCPLLLWEDKGRFESYKDGYSCKECGKKLDANEVKYKCWLDFGDSYGDPYEDCEIYKNRR